MKLCDLLESIECSCSAALCDKEISALTVDSRKADSTSLFCCIRGLSRDGHDFAADCAAKGAVVLVDHDMKLDSQIIVEDTRLAFAQVCENWFGNPLRRLRLVGITGTNGKTSTTYLLKHILEELGHKTGLIGTIQNMVGEEIVPAHFTTPDTYDLHELFGRMADAGCEYCVMEVSSFALAQGRVAGLSFDTACFTNLTQDHLDVHPTMEDYFAAKCLLFERCSKAVINTDDEWARKIVLAADVERLTLSAHGEAGIFADEVVCSADSVEFNVNIPERGFIRRVRAGIPGRFTVYNLLSAAGCAYELGIEPDAICDALNTAKGVKGRAEVYPTNRDFTVVIDYAHSPDGVVNILRSMRELTKGRLVALLGCGGDRDPVKRPLMGEAASLLADFVIVTSDNPRSENPSEIIKQIIPGVEKHDTPYIVIENRREAIEYAVRNAEKDDVVVLAGKGHETYQILNTGTIHFDEREVLAEVFARLDSEGR